MSRSTFQQLSFIAKLAVLWLVLLVVPFTERTLLGAKSYYFLYIGLGLVFVMYGPTIRSIFFFLQHTRREPIYVWIAYLLWSIFICSVLAVFAIEYDLLPHTSGPSITQGRPLIDYLYYEIITLTTVGYGDITGYCTRETSRYLHRSSWCHTRCDVCGAGSSGFDPIPTWQRSRMIERYCSRWSDGLHCEFGFIRSASTRLGIPLP
jgi:Ion channel